MDNNLAPEMIDVLEEKLDSMFHDGMIYEWSFKFWMDKMLGYIKRVGNINEKDLNGIELSAIEIAFIYRLIKFDITLMARKMGLRADNYMSFGNSQDPRMDEIVSRRDHKKDFDKLPYEYQVIFLKMYDFPEIKVTDPNLIIDSGKIEYSSDDLLKDTKFVRKFLSTHKHSLILPYTKTNINNNKKLVM